MVSRHMSILKLSHQARVKTEIQAIFWFGGHELMQMFCFSQNPIADESRKGPEMRPDMY
jgi:hypothetical protein